MAAEIRGNEWLRLVAEPIALENPWTPSPIEAGLEPLRKPVTAGKVEGATASPERAIVVTCPEAAYEGANDCAGKLAVAEWKLAVAEWKLAVAEWKLATLGPANNPLTDGSDARLAVASLPLVPEKPGLNTGAANPLSAGWNPGQSRVARAVWLPDSPIGSLPPKKTGRPRPVCNDRDGAFAPAGRAPETTVSSTFPLS